MTLLDRYLFKLFSKNLFLVLASLLTIYLLVHFFERIDDFMRANESLSLAAKYFLLKIPQMVEELIPITILLSGIISLGLINHQGEFIVLRAAGIHTTRIVTPLLFSAIIFILGTLLLAEWIVPTTTAATNKILYEQVRKERPRGIVRNDRYYYSDEQGVYSFKRPDAYQNLFNNFSYARWDNDYNLQLLLSAPKATWNNGTWTFTNCQLKQPDSSDSYNVEYFKEKELPLKATPADFFTPPYKINEMSLSGLYSKGNKGEGPQNIEASLKFLERVSLILLGLPLLMLGLPILMLAHQKWRKDISTAILISCGLAFAVWGWWGTMQSFAKGGIVHPLMAAWLIHLLIGSIGVMLLLRQDT
jgi:lipopolysaccharide export system permease protein